MLGLCGYVLASPDFGMGSDMMIDNIQWQQTCCAWHGEYAETKTKAGGMVRIKRAPDMDGYLAMRFGPYSKAIDVDGDGVPDYVVMTEGEVELLLRE